VEPKKLIDIVFNKQKEKDITEENEILNYLDNPNKRKGFIEKTFKVY